MTKFFDVDMLTRVQILEESVCISHNDNNLEKGMHLNILPQAMGN